MLTSKQKKVLKSEAHHLKPVVQIGKEGLTDNVIISIAQSLKAHELIKVSLLESNPDPKEQIILDVCARTRCEFVQSIGRLLIFYKPSEKRLYQL